MTPPPDRDRALPPTDEDWTSPLPRHRINRRRVLAGILLSTLARLAKVVVAGRFLAASSDVSAVLPEALLFLGCVGVGAVVMLRVDRGLGLGLVVGWAVGLLLSAVLLAGSVVVGLH